MKRKISIAFLGSILVSCMIIGISGFRSLGNHTESTIGFHQVKKNFGVEDFNNYRFQTDKIKVPLCINYVDPENEPAMDNSKFQLIHWDWMTYQNRF